jgi:hypothetical protein
METMKPASGFGFPFSAVSTGAFEGCGMIQG